MSIYTEKYKATEKELEKTRETLVQLQHLEQRLLGRLVTLQELQDEDKLADVSNDAVADSDESTAE